MKTKKHYDKNDFIMTLLKGRTFIVLIILVILFSILSENFFSTSTLLMVAKHVALYGILAIGMTYVIITGGIDLSVGSVVGLGGIIGGYLIQKGLTVGGYTLYFSVPMVILIVILLGCAIGWVNGAVITKLRVAPFIATLGTMYICRGFANIISTGRTFSSLAGYEGLGNTGFKFMGSSIMGIPVGAILLIILSAIAASVLGGTSMAGGIGTIGGTFVGAFVIGVLNDGMAMCGVTEFWQNVIKGAVIILAIQVHVLRAVFSVAEADIQLRQQGQHSLLGAQRQARPGGGKTDCAIYRAGVHIYEAEACGGGPCKRALAGAGWAVYGHGNVFIQSSHPCQRICGDKGRRPGYLQIIPARIRVEVQHLAGEIQTRHELRLHRARVHLRRGDAAGGDYRLRYRPRPGERNGEKLQKLRQRCALLPCYRIGPRIARYAGELHQDGYHGPACEVAQGIAELAVAVFFKVPQKPGVQLLLVQSRLQVDGEAVSALTKPAHMSRGGEHQRA